MKSLKQKQIRFVLVALLLVRDRLGLRHISFHCTRVTVVTRLARNGLIRVWDANGC